MWVLDVWVTRTFWIFGRWWFCSTWTEAGFTTTHLVSAPNDPCNAMTASPKRGKSRVLRMRRGDEALMPLLMRLRLFRGYSASDASYGIFR